MKVLLSVVVGCVLGSACPLHGDEFDDFGALMRDGSGFNTEFERLLGLFVNPPDPASVDRGVNNLLWTVTTGAEKGRVGFRLSDPGTGDEWTLWAWHGTGLGADDVEIVSDEITPEGRRVVASLGDGLVTVTLEARWVRGRYLRVERSLVGNGDELPAQLAENLSLWTVEGPSVPYRFCPAEKGPYGVVETEDADGGWRGKHYPLWSMVPAVAAFDRSRGVMLAVADAHARLLDRRYGLLYRIAPPGSSAEQIGLQVLGYHPDSDRYAASEPTPGVALTDVVVLEPFELTSSSRDPTLLEAEVLEIIGRTGDVVRAFHWVPDPPGASPEGNVAWLEEWWDGMSPLADLVQWLYDTWGVRYTESWLCDAALDYGGKVGIGAAELPGGEGLAEEIRDRIRDVDPELIPFFSYCNFLIFSRDDAYHRARPEWIARDAEGNPYNKLAEYPDNLLFDVRNPEVAGWAVRKMQVDMAEYPEIAGYRFDTTTTVPVEGQAPAQGPYAVGYYPAAYATYLKTAEAVTAARPDARLASNKGLRLCLPAFCSFYANGDGTFGIGFWSEEPDPPMPFENRMSNHLYSEVFGVHPYIGFGGHSLSAQVIATTSNVRGHSFFDLMQEHAGFDAFVSHLDELRAAGGELIVLHSDPPRCRYAGCGNVRPAVADELIAVLPADARHSTTVWVAFHGTGGGVAITDHRTLAVTWPGGEAALDLPRGCWCVNHPSPNAVSPGDAVLIERIPCPPRRSAGRPSGARHNNVTIPRSLMGSKI